MLTLITYTASMASKSAQVGLIMPQTINGETELSTKWKQVTCAAKLAVAHVKSGTETIVPGLADLTSNLTNFDATLYDTGYRPSPAIVSYRQVWPHQSPERPVPPSQTHPNPRAPLTTSPTHPTRPRR